MRDNNINELKEPVFLNNAVLLSRQEYDRLYKENIAYKILQAKQEIAEGKVFSHE